MGLAETCAKPSVYGNVMSSGDQVTPPALLAFLLFKGTVKTKGAAGQNQAAHSRLTVHNLNFLCL
jgi:hypothetical protein